VLEGWQQDMLRLVNNERREAGLPPMTANAVLAVAAHNHAEDMEQRNFFSHTNPDGKNSFARIRDAGYFGSPCGCTWQVWTGENIANGQQTVSQVMEDWMQSPGHRENILNPAFTEIGFGRAGTYWVQDFGTLLITPPTGANSSGNRLPGGTN
jgi:uncharacterized protein YkwD